jgi:glycosyltransferase involved in cell wall biosynthesis
VGVVRKLNVLALISAFNEAGRISSTINALKEINLIDEIIVVNDGSTDNTGEISKNAGAKVINLPQNVGKGRALNFALGKVKYDTLLLIDGDLGKSALEAEKLVKPVLEGKADMVIADFPKPQKKGGFGFVKNLARWGIKRSTGITFQEPLSGQRAIKQKVMASVKNLEKGFGVEVGLTIDAIQNGFKVIEVSTNMSHAETGRDIKGFMHRGKQFRDVLKVVMKRLLDNGGRMQRIKFF